MALVINAGPSATLRFAQDDTSFVMSNFVMSKRRLFVTYDEGNRFWGLDS